jgi:putative FmdB family regulatory protein
VPVYQYACTECGDQLEVRQSFTDDALTVCPACSGRLRKVLSAVGVVFKGSGFYRTDSRADAKSSDTTTSTSNGSRDSSTPGKESSSKESSSKESSATSTTDSKPSTSSTAATVA